MPSSLDPIAALLASGQARRAAQAAQQALVAAAPEPARLLEVALALHGLGLGDVTDAVFSALLARNPGHADLQLRGALYWLSTGRAEAALAAVRALLEAHRLPDLWVLEAQALSQLERPAEAAAALRRAVEAAPGRADWWRQLGDALRADRRSEEAVQAYQQGLAVAESARPGDPAGVAALLQSLAGALAGVNLVDAAAGFSDRALALTPDDPAAVWQDLTLLPALYGDADALPAARARFSARLTALEARLPVADPGAWIQSLKLPFYLHYQGGDLLPEMRRYGRVCHALAQAWRPDLVAAPAPPPAADGRIRVAIVSEHLRRHTVSKLFGAWLQVADRGRVSLRAVHLGRARDATTEALAAAVERFDHRPGAAPDAVCRLLRAAQTDVVVFPELGMSPATWRVAMLRSAPIQVVGWGHPVPTGLPTLDAVVSSAAMEPPDGDAHYVARLLRLPGLGIQPPPPPAPSAQGRSRFGLGDDEVVFLIPQAPFKLLPDADAVYARILAGVPRSRLVVLGHAEPAVTGQLAARLRAALSAAGVAPDRLTVAPQLPWADYLALNAVSDVFLDGLSWSGGMTTLEALAVGLVPVTCPGSVMRARHTAGILRQAGLDELVAPDRDAYVALACALGRDPARRAALSARCRAAAVALAADPSPAQALWVALEDLHQERIDAAN